MEDVLYFQEKLYRSLNVPVSRLEQENTGFNLGRSSEITREEVKFAKFISRLRRKFSSLFLELLERQVVLKGIMTIEEWKAYSKQITFDFANDGFFKELKDNEIAMARIDTYNGIAPLIGKYYSHSWVRKNILQQTKEDIDVMNQEIIAEQSDPILNPPMIDDGSGNLVQNPNSMQNVQTGSAGGGDDSNKLTQATNTYQRLINKDNKSLQDQAKLKSASQIIAKSGDPRAKQILQKYNAGVKL